MPLGPDSDLAAVRVALEECERRCSAILRASEDLMFCLDREGRHLEFHAPSLDHLFRRPSEFLGKTVDEVLPAPAAALYREHIAGALADGEARSFEYSLVFPERGLQHYEARLVPRDAERVVVMVRAITERKLLQEARVRAQKLASVGLLASGIAHDFNNLLTPIVANIDLAQAVLPADSPALPFLRDAAAGAQRSAELVQQLLSYAGRGGEAREDVDLGALFRDMAELQRSAFPEAALRYTLAAGLPRVRVDATQMRQVAGNLLANAAQAIGAGPGEIHIEVWSAALDADALARIRPDKALAPGVYVCARVSDTGPGLAPEHRHLIFDPYFTTKQTGTGLGLAIVLGVVRGHQGAVRVESTPGAGASFTIYLPAAA